MICDEISVGRNVCGRNVREAKCPGACCPWGEMALGRVVLGASCLWAEMTMGRNVMGRVSMGQVVNEAIFDGASSTGITNPLSRHIPLIRKFFVSTLISELADSGTY
jgi:hypothetical protein